MFVLYHVRLDVPVRHPYRDDQWVVRSVNKELVEKIEVVMHCATTFWSMTEYIYDDGIP